MNRKTFFSFFIIALVAMSSCKSKQLVTEISSAHEPAQDAVQSDAYESQTVTPIVEFPEAVARVEEENTRSEAFRLAAGETNAAAMSKKYHVQVGAFRNHNNAKALRDKLAAEGNSPMMVENNQGMLRVIIASFDEYKDARAKINQINRTFPDAWILVQSK